MEETKRISFRAKALILKMQIISREIKIGCLDDKERLRMLDQDFESFID